MTSLLAHVSLLIEHLHGEQIIFVLLAAGAVFLFSLALLTLVSTASDPLRRRIDQLTPPQAGPSLLDKLSAHIRPLATLVRPKREGEQSRVRQLLTHAGYRSASTLSTFYGTKALLMTALPLAVLFAWPWFPSISPGRLGFYALVSVCIGSLLPSLWLERRCLARQRLLRAGFPDALDLLVVCVEAGLGLAAALQKVADEIVVSHPQLGAELALVNAEMRAGVERAQSLKNLAERTGLPDIRGLVALMVQTMRFGTSIADALRVYAEEFRDKRMQLAEEAAAKIGTKMIFPLVFCLFPAFFLVAIGPAVIRLISAFSQIPR